MTPEEFEKQFEELLKAAPEGSTLLCTYSNPKEKRPTILLAQGNPSEIIFNLASFGEKDETAKRILTLVPTALTALKILK